MENCGFCSEINLHIDDFNLFNRYFSGVFNTQDRVAFRNEKWLFLPTAGCYVEGYLLAVNESHYASFYQCPYEDKIGLIYFFSELNKMYRDIYKSRFIYFEHGAVKNEYKSTCCIDHVHLHFGPFNKPIWQEVISTYKAKYYTLNSLLELNELIDSKGIASYLLFGDADGEIYLIDSTSDIFPSQFFRMLLYNYFYIDNNVKWDWRKYFFIDNMYNTYLKFKSYREL